MPPDMAEKHELLDAIKLLSKIAGRMILIRLITSVSDHLLDGETHSLALLCDKRQQKYTVVDFASICFCFPSS